MVKVTVSAKVPQELAQRISDSGYSTSNVMLVGIEMFLNLPSEDQEAMIWDYLQRKKRERAVEKFGMHKYKR